MKQHAVPQAIMEVEFNLFGAMNVRQFGYVAGSGGVGYFLYLIMPGILKWPMAIICVLFGLALAFIPLDDRPMDQWVTNFLLSLKRTTRRVWKSTVEPPAFLLDTPGAIEKGYGSARPAVIEKKGGMEGAGVFSAIDKEVAEVADKEVREVDNELLQMVSEAKRNVATFAKKPQVPETHAQQSILTDAQYDTESPEEKFAASATAMKSLTTQPGVINGGVYDIEGTPVQDAIIILRDNQKRPVQVVKTNSKGLFLADSAVNPGEYIITVEKGDMRFESRRIVVLSEVLPFIEIKAI